MFRSFLLICAGFLYPCPSAAQVIVSVSNGAWNAPSTWSAGVIPSASNSDSVLIEHEVIVPAGESLLIDNLFLNGRLIVTAGAEISIANGDTVDVAVGDAGKVDVYGTLIGQDGITLGGMNASNTIFHAGSIYRHLAVRDGQIPLASWHPDATLEIAGIETSTTMQSTNWSQTFGNVVYDCPNQGAFVSFKGLLRHISGDFIIRDTNGSTLQLSKGEGLVLQVDGTIQIEGPSVVWFSADGNASVSVNGNLLFASTSTRASYFTTTGQASITVNGNLVIDAQHRLKMASGSATGHTDLTLKGDLQLLHGKLDALETGSGTLIFDGTQPQHVVTITGEDTGFDGNLSYVVTASADVDLGVALLSNSLNGGVTVEGILRLGSLNTAGVIQAGPAGNIQVQGPVTFAPGSQVVFNGSDHQYINHPDFEYCHVFIDNPSGLTLLTETQFGSLTIGQGTFYDNANDYRLRSNLSIEASATLQSSGTLWLNGTGEQVLDIRGDTLVNVTVQNGGGSDVQLISPLILTGVLSLRSPGSDVISDGYLTLSSTSETGSTASIGSLPAGSMVAGPVTVQRFMLGAGDKYRYISSPVVDARVASLMDDIPVTGIFDDADTGPGLPEDAPSLFFYSEPRAEWMAFPASGSSATNYLIPGKGYSIFNWNGSDDTNWDVTGEINQGEFGFDLTYTPTADEELYGWNLVGNPYPSAIQWGAVGWVSDNVSTGIAVRDNLAGGFLYSDDEIGSFDGAIASGQAFWVRTLGASPTLTITESAKVSDGAEYYRKSLPSYVELEVRRGKRLDRAFLRLRDGARKQFDGYDAPKFPNDSLSLSFLTADKVKVAIDAVSELPCVASIPIDVADFIPVQMDLTVSIRAEGLLSAASYSLLDTGTGKRHTFTELGSVAIPGADWDSNNLNLVIESGVPVRAQASAAGMVCQRDTLWVTLMQNKQPGISYYLEKDGSRIDPVAGVRGPVLAFPSDSLVAGFNTYFLMGASPCHDPVQIDSIQVHRSAVLPPVPTGGFVCGKGAVELSAFSESDSGQIFWFDTSTSGRPVSSGDEFVTPVLTKSKEYYASVRDSFGCESIRIPVGAMVKAGAEATIESVGGMLEVAGIEGIRYQWYLNDSILEDQNRHFIVADQPGVYKVVASNGDCSATGEYAHLITSWKGAEHERPVVAFPAPCHESLFVQYPTHYDDRERFDIYTLQGIRVSAGIERYWNDTGCRLDLTNLPAGQYVLRISGEAEPIYLRFIKID